MEDCVVGGVVDVVFCNKVVVRGRLSIIIAPFVESGLAIARIGLDADVCK